MSTESAVLLTPRPYAVFSGRLLLLPLLPHRRPLKPLPSEIWSHIFSFTLECDVAHLNGLSTARWNGSQMALLTVCKSFTEIALPLFYTRVHLHTVSSLERFTAHLHSADQKWDSIRRIPYSTPGRWVQVLDVSAVAWTSQPQAFLLDSLLTQLFPLLPFLTRFSLSPSFVLSRRALSSLAFRDGIEQLRVLEGVSYIPVPGSSTEDDAVVQLLRRCVNLQALEIIGPGLDPTEFEFPSETVEANLLASFKPLNLPHLNNMTLLSMHSSPLLLALLHSPLPSLRKLTITPYDDIPASLVSQFIIGHGQLLRSLLLFTPKSWPTRLHPSPLTLLETSPNLRHLSLENPLPELTLPPYSSSTAPHPLQILSIPRPKPEFWNVLESLLPRLPSLRAVRSRDVRWLRRGMTLHAQGAGVQGEMREWRRRLGRRGIRVLDADWNECE